MEKLLFPETYIYISNINLVKQLGSSRFYPIDK